MALIGCGKYNRISSLCQELGIDDNNMFCDNSLELYTALGRKKSETISDVLGEGLHKEVKVGKV